MTKGQLIKKKDKLQVKAVSYYFQRTLLFEAHGLCLDGGKLKISYSKSKQEIYSH